MQKCQDGNKLDAIEKELTKNGLTGLNGKPLNSATICAYMLEFYPEARLQIKQRKRKGLKRASRKVNKSVTPLVAKVKIVRNENDAVSKLDAIKSICLSNMQEKLALIELVVDER